LEIGYSLLNESTNLNEINLISLIATRMTQWWLIQNGHCLCSQAIFFLFILLIFLSDLDYNIHAINENAAVLLSMMLTNQQF
jgi:hypothetical protein